MSVSGRAVAVHVISILHSRLRLTVVSCRHVSIVYLKSAGFAPVRTICRFARRR